MRVTVAIPTMRRPDGLMSALRSVFAQDVPATLSVAWEIVVADNCPDHSAREAIASLRSEAPVPLTVVHAPTPGVANARNAIWRAARGDMLAFLDDDQVATPGWLAGLIEARATLDTPVVFGAIRSRLPRSQDRLNPYYADRFARHGVPGHAVLAHYYGCGNCLIDRRALSLEAPPFCASANDIGGEDDLLFHRLQQDGTRFGWSGDALAEEVVPAHRATLSYTMKRAFAFGQGPSQSCANASPPDIPGIARWMVIGAGQALVFGVLALFALPFNRVQAVRWLDRAVQGVGKVLWAPIFEPRLYGRAMLKPIS